LDKIIQYLDSIISGEKKGVLPSILKGEMLELSFFALALTKLRRWMYSCGLINSERLPCKVISVGNVVVGGSGKTPAVIAITRLLNRHTDLKIAIASRGYKSRSKGVAIVSDDKGILLDSDKAGDEPYLLGRNLTGIPVIIGKDRYKSGLIAIDKWGTDVLILDDGFQYLKLKRDVDIITMDSTKPFGLDYLLPRGYLRESLSTLKNADAIILTKVDQCENLDYIYKRLDKISPKVPIFESIHAPSSLIKTDTSENVSFDKYKGCNILAVSGIANPKSFAKTLDFLNPSRLEIMAFPDHHDYSQKDIENIEQSAIKTKADIIIITEKDAPKLIGIKAFPVLTLAIELKLLGSADTDLLRLITEKCNLTYI
jgi:tetraacyldisaccharide 4'-kinase